MEQALVSTKEDASQISILNASYLAMHRAIEQLSVVRHALLIDGNRFITYNTITHHCIIKGDAKFMSIAAASILAKTYRDDQMDVLHGQHPKYGWNSNKGYPTAIHRKQIHLHGITAHHRRTFRLLPEQLKLDFG